MNGIENIINRITEDAEKESKEILARAQHEAGGIRESFAQLAKNEASEIVAKGKKLADERTVRLSGVAQLEARKMMLKTKQQLIEIAFKEAIKKLESLEGDEYVETLATLAVSAIVSGNEEIILSNADREKYGKAVVSLANKKLNEGQTRKDKLLNAAGKLLRGEGLRLSDETRDIDGGLILKDGALEVDASFKTIVNQMRDQLAGDVANILFG